MTSGARLRAVLVLSVFLLTPLAAHADVDADLDALAARYRAFGLPLPPPSAELVTVPSGLSYPRGKPPTPVLHLAFRAPGPPGTPRRLWVGPATIDATEARHLRVTPIAPERVDLGRLTSAWDGVPFGINAGLGVAVQAWALGHKALARRLLPWSLAQAAGHPFSFAHSPAGRPPQTALAELIIAHLANELARPGTDRRAIAAQLARVMKVPGVASPARRGFLKALQRSLAWRPLPRRPEALRTAHVRALIEGLLGETIPQSSDEPLPAGPVYRELVRRGFSAVPALIDHLDDERLTRALLPALNNFPPRFLRLGERVADLLQGLSGNVLARERDWLKRRQGQFLPRAAARAWWEEASALGEERYALAHIVPRGASWPAAHLVELVAARHPHRLGEIYRRVIGRYPLVQSWPVARAIARSRLPQAERVALLAQGLADDQPEHRRVALAELMRVDPGRFVAELGRALETLPASPSGPYWSCPEGAYALFATYTSDPGVWQALLAAAKRADVGLRMELLHRMGYAAAGAAQRRQRIAFLRAFLDDTTVRDAKSDPRRFEGPHAGFGFPRMRVQDLAALTLAGILGLKAGATPAWSDAEWRALRERVRRAKVE